MRFHPYPAYPLWATLPLTAFVAVLVPIYWHEYGPANFLWFSDIALFAVLIAFWTGNRLVYSAMAVGVLPFEVVWVVDFLAGGNLVGLAAYMFDEKMALHMRLLSGFHLVIPSAIVWMLVRQGYDERAWWVQMLLAWAMPLASWVLTPAQDNINWVHGLGEEADMPLPPLVYVALYMALVPGSRHCTYAPCFKKAVQARIRPASGHDFNLRRLAINSVGQ